MENTTIRDNRKFGSVKEFLEEKIKDNSKLSVVSAYFTIYAYYALRGKLDSIKGMRFLFGEPTFAKTENLQKLIRDFKICDDSLKINHSDRMSQKYIAKKCHDWINDKVEVKTIDKPDFLHGKMYLIEKSYDDTVVQEAITGSSNFTYKGLGFEESGNIELNLITDSSNQKKELKAWFDDIWNNNIDGISVSDVKAELLKYLETLYEENPPEFIYFKTLYEIFSNTDTEIDPAANKKFVETKIWNLLYDFQKDSLKGIINRIEKYNGCILADSVGLGKTFTALAVIKYYETVKKLPNTLIICPKKLKSNWTQYQARKHDPNNILQDDNFDYEVVFHTDMNRKTGESPDGIPYKNFQWEDYDLVVIDESHNFKGKLRGNEEDSESWNRSKFLMEKILKSGRQTKVLLLSATPVNNSFMDLKHQIDFIDMEDQTILKDVGIQNINNTLTAAQRQFKSWSNPSTKNKSKQALMGQFNSDLYKLLDELTIAKSRKHIMNFYNGSGVGKFPTRLKPISLYPEIDISNTFKSYHEIEKLLNGFKLSIFNPSKYVKEEFQPIYEQQAKSIGAHDVNFDQSEREVSLIGMMKMGYLKRLESSIFSFKESMGRIIGNIDNYITKIEKYLASGKEDIVENQIDNQDDENSELDDDFEVGKSLKFNLAHLRLQREKKNDEKSYWLEDLKEDREKLNELYEAALDVINTNNDNKLSVLKEQIRNKVSHPINGNNKKVIIFTAYADTANYLYDNIADWAKKELNLNSAVVCGSICESTGNWRKIDQHKFENILTDFAPMAKHRKEQINGEFDILIATDCISEGQNLQDCDYLVNYDIHWNPVRIIQRFGRIDRIGSDKCGVDKIQMVNFWPTKELDSYINLESRVRSRAILADVAATSEDNVLDENKQPVIDKNGVESNLAYRDNQLKELQTEVLDMEDLDGNISLSDFSFDNFKLELQKYISNSENLAKLQNAPNGLYSIVPACIENQIGPGVIFCLKKNEKQDGKILKNDSTKVNPLEPYYLAYVKDDKTLAFGFANPKNILDIFRELSYGKKDPYQELCEIFSKQTKDGIKMDEYSNLLKVVTQKTSAEFKNKDLFSMLNNGTTLTGDSSNSNETNDYSLVTWLIIK